MQGDSAFVAITLMPSDKSVVPAEVVFPWGSSVDKLDWGIRPTSLVAQHLIFKGRQPKRGRQSTILAIDVYGQIIVRRSLLTKVMAAFPAERLAFIPVALFEEGELLDDDFAMLDPELLFPMDRDAAVAEWADPANPHGSLVRVVRQLEWQHGRAPDATAFRLGEQPQILLMRRAVAEALVKATKQAVVIATAPYPGRERRFGLGPQPRILAQYQEHGVEANLPAWQPPQQASASAQAFWQLWAGPQDAGARALALQSPHYALWLALLVDRGPGDDTRQAALRHPLYAYRYANLVDKGPRADTRQAAAQVPQLACLYARFVDRGAHEVTRLGVAGSDWAGQYDQDCAEGQRGWALAQAAISGQAPPTPPAQTVAPAPPAPPVAPRNWPPHDRPRYAEAAVHACDAQPSDAQPHDPPCHDALSEALRADIDAAIARGLALLEVPPQAPPEAVVSAIHALVGQVQAKQRKLGKDKASVLLALGCAFGEQLHRALGWQWAQVRTPHAAGIALIHPDRAVACYALHLVERQLAPRQTVNGIALSFNMLADGVFPPGARAGAYAAVS